MEKDQEVKSDRTMCIGQGEIVHFDGTNGNTEFQDIANAVVQDSKSDESDVLNQESNNSNLSINPVVASVASESPTVNASASVRLCDYDSDSDASVEELPAPESDVVELKNNYNYRMSQQVLSDSEEDSEDSDSDEYTDDSSSSASSSSASSSSSTAVASSDDSDSDSDIVLPAAPKPKIIRNDEPRTEGELTISDLPPIEDLHISVPEQQCTELGHIESIVDTLVVVQAKKNSPPLDLDSVLFLDKGNRPLGRVFDVFGPVTEPCYCIRFNSPDHIRDKEVVKGMLVYSAPRSEFSSYVFLPDLLKMKGSDASWEYNNEPPRKYLDYSDDDEERRLNKLEKGGANREPKEVDPDQPRRKKRNKYEQFMNSRNLRMSAMNPPATYTTPTRNPWGGPWGPQRGAAFINSPPPPSSVSTGFQTPPPGLIRPSCFSVPPPSFGTVPTPPPMFSSPPPPFPVGVQPFSSFKERPGIPKYDPSTPPPPGVSPLVSPCMSSLPFNIPPLAPVGMSNPERLPTNLFQIPPPPPLPSATVSQMTFLSTPPPLSQMTYLSTPPPQPQPSPAPPNHW